MANINSPVGSRSVPRAIEAFGRGGIVVVVGAGCDGEADLVMAASATTPAKVAFFIEHTSGVICAPLPAARAEQLELPSMVASGTDGERVAFTVTVDVAHGTTTGISAADRCATIRALCDEATRPTDLRRPGHIVPLLAATGGVLRRPGHGEAAVDLARLAGLPPVGVICGLVDEAKTGMARGAEAQRFAAAHGVPLVSVAELVRYRQRHERLVRRVSTADVAIRTRYGTFTASVLESTVDGSEHLILTMGDLAGASDVLVRVHAECLAGDVFGSLACDCGAQLRAAMRAIARAGCGAVINVRGHDRGRVGLACSLADGLDDRDLDVAAQLLRELGAATIRLVPDAPSSHEALVDRGVSVSERRSGMTRRGGGRADVVVGLSPAAPSGDAGGSLLRDAHALDVHG